MQAMAWAGFTGVGLAMVVPAAMSIIADYYQSAVRGRAFGALFTVAALGECKTHPLIRFQIML